MKRDKINYSPLETRILALIPKDESKITTEEITNRVYRPGEAPFNARATVLHGLNRLIAKSDENEEPWEIFKSKRRGSQPAYFWREPRKRVSDDKSDERKVPS
jgi:hypothetical protein